MRSLFGFDAGQARLGHPLKAVFFGSVAVGLISWTVDAQQDLSRVDSQLHELLRQTPTSPLVPTLRRKRESRMARRNTRVLYIAIATAAAGLDAYVDAQLADLDPDKKTDKRKIAALNKDKAALTARLAQTDAIIAAIGGQLTEAEARELILKKLYDLISNELNRYLNAEKRRLIALAENLWDKYAVSSRELENRRAETLKTLDGFFQSLGYFGGTIKGERGKN